MKDNVRKFLMCSVVAVVMMITAVISVATGFEKKKDEKPPVETVVKVWDGETKLKPTGTGAKNDPYIISSPENLAYLSTEADFSKFAYYLVTDDLDMGGHHFVSIGNGANTFKGVFDGNGHKIFNIGEDEEGYYSSSSKQAPSLFGMTGMGEITDLTVEYAYTQAVNTIAYGGIAQYSIGDTKFLRCANITEKIEFLNSYAGYQAFGGILGRSRGDVTIEDCYSLTDLTFSGKTRGLGGLLGYCDFDGNVIRNSYTAGKMMALSGSELNIGNIVGFGYDPNPSLTLCVLENTYSIYDTEGSITNTPDKWDTLTKNSSWQIDPNLNNGLPFLVSSEDESVGDSYTRIVDVVEEDQGAGVVWSYYYYEFVEANLDYDIDFSYSSDSSECYVTITYRVTGYVETWAECYDSRGKFLEGEIGFTEDPIDDEGTIEEVYTENGWYIVSVWECGNPADSAEFITLLVDFDVDGIASWVETYVYFDANGGTVDGRSSSDYWYYFDENNGSWDTEYWPSADHREGYTFEGWCDSSDGDATYYSSVDEISIGDSLTLWAIWSPNQYSLTMNANGGVVSPAEKTVVYDTAYGTLPTPTRAGYTFNGWYTQASGGTQVYSTTIYTNAGDSVIFAHWTQNKVTVNLGTLTNVSKVYYGTSADAINTQLTSSFEAVSGVTYYFKAELSTQTGYTTTFTGWSGWFSSSSQTTSYSFTEGSGSVTLNASASMVQNTATIKLGILTNIDKVYYGTSAGSITTQLTASGFTATSNTTYYFKAELATATGYTFAFSAWSGDFVSGSSNPASNSFTANGGVYTISASASKTANSYDITYDLNGGSHGTSHPASYVYSATSQTVTVSTPTKVGSTFSSWTVSGNATISGTTLKINAGATGVITLTANWTANSGSISYNGLDGAQYSGLPTAYEAPNNLTFTLSSPSMYGYIFTGWTLTSGSATISGSTLTVDSSTTDGIILTANWTAKEVPLVYDLGYRSINASTSEPGLVNYPATISNMIATDGGASTNYYVNWDQDFSISVQFSIADHATRKMIFGAYNNVASLDATDLNLETYIVNSNSYLRLWVGTGQVNAILSDKNAVPLNTIITATVTWDVDTKIISLVSFGDNFNVSYTHTTALSITGTHSKPLAFGTDYRGYAQFGAVDIGPLFVTEGTENTKVYGVTATYKGNYPTTFTPARSGFTFNGWHDKTDIFDFNKVVWRYPAIADYNEGIVKYSDTYWNGWAIGELKNLSMVNGVRYTLEFDIKLDSTSGTLGWSASTCYINSHTIGYFEGLTAISSTWQRISATFTYVPDTEGSYVNDILHIYPEMMSATCAVMIGNIRLLLTDSDVNITSSSTVNTACTHTLKANWTQNYYQTTFSAGNGNIAVNSGVYSGSGVQATKDFVTENPYTTQVAPNSSNISRAGYTFGGWYEATNWNISGTHAYNSTDKCVRMFTSQNGQSSTGILSAGVTVGFDVTLDTTITLIQINDVNLKYADYEIINGTRIRVLLTLTSDYINASDSALSLIEIYTDKTSVNYTINEFWTTDYSKQVFNTSGILNASVGGYSDANKCWIKTSSSFVVPKWTANSYTVTFNANDGVVSPAEKTVVYNTAYGTLPTPTRSGYAFVGWFYNGVQITSSTIMNVASSHILDAKWNANSYTATLNANGGTISSLSGWTNANGNTTSTKTVTYDTTYGALPTVTRAGYAFNGWYESNSVTNLFDVNDFVDYMQDQYYSVYGYNSNLSYNESTGILSMAGWHGYNANTRTYFLYKPDLAPGTYTMSYKGYVAPDSSYDPATMSTTGFAAVALDGSNLSSGIISSLTEQSIVFTFTIPASGWKGFSILYAYYYLTNFYDISLVRGTTAGTDYTVPNNVNENSYHKKAGNITLYANWVQNQFTVTLNNQSATTAGTTSVTATYGEQLPKITVPTKTGYTFGGYYTQTNGGGTQYYSSDGTGIIYNLNSATTLYAEWIENGYTVIYNSNVPAGVTVSGTVASTQHTYNVAKALSTNVYTATGVVYYAYGTNLASSYSENKTLTFVGWNTKADGTGTMYASGESVKNLTSDASITLYAQWKVQLTLYLSYALITHDTQLVVLIGDIATATLNATGSSATIDLEYSTDPIEIVATTSNSSQSYYMKISSDYMDISSEKWSIDGFNTQTITYTPSGNTNLSFNIYETFNVFSSIATDSDSQAGITSSAFYYKWSDNEPIDATSYLNGRAGSGIAFYATVNEGYTFKGWTITETDDTLSPSSTSSTVNFDHLNYTIVSSSEELISKSLDEGTFAYISGTGAYVYIYKKSSSVDAGLKTDVTAVASATANEYTLMLNANGGVLNPDVTGWTYSNDNTIATKSVTFNTTYGTLPNPTRSGYNFAGWYTASDGGTKVTESTVMGVSNITIHAHWNLAGYLAFDANGGTSNGNALASKRIAIGEALGTLPAISHSYPKFERDGYNFLGWFTASEGGSQVTAETLRTEGMDTLYAHWSPITFRIIYNGNGATSGSMNPSTHVYDDGSRLTANAFERTGYTFLGWNNYATSTSASYSDKYGASSVYYWVEVYNRLVTGSDGVPECTLYAIWEINTYNLTVDGNGGQIESSNVYFEYVSTDGCNGTILGNSITGVRASQCLIFASRDGLVHDYWDYFEAEDAGEIYSSVYVWDDYGSAYDNYNGSVILTATAGETIAIYSVDDMYEIYSPDFKVTFPVDGTFEIAFTYDGYAGAYYDVAILLRVAVEGESENIFSSIVSTDGCTGTVSGTTVTGCDAWMYILAGREGLFEDCWNYYDAKPVMLDYVNTQDAWNDGSSTYSYTLTVSLKEAQTIELGGINDMEDLLGPWFKLTLPEAGVYTISFDFCFDEATLSNIQVKKTYNYANGYVERINLSIKYNEVYFDSLPVAERTGYSFTGWNTASNGSETTINASSRMPANDLTIYAQWISNDYELVFDLNGGDMFDDNTTSKTYSVTFNTAYGTLPTAVKAGYTFTGWNTKPDGSGEWVTETTKMTTEGATVYAIYNIATYTLTINFGDIKLSNNTTINITATGCGTTSGSITTASSGATFTTTHVYDPTNSYAITFTKQLAGANYRFTIGSSTADNTITYNWKPTDNTTITLDVAQLYVIRAYSQTGISTVTYSSNTTVAHGTSASFSATMNSGYEFDGWYNGTSSSKTLISSSNPYNVTVTSALTLYAYGRGKTYLITFDKQGGTGGSNTVSVTYGQKLPSITVPTRVGYQFMGYYGSIGNYSIEDLYYSPSGAGQSSYYTNENKTLYAYWTKIETILTLNANGGTFDSDGTVIQDKFSEDIIVSTVLTLNGNTLSDYFVMGSGGGSYYINDVLQGDTYSFYNMIMEDLLPQLTYSDTFSAGDTLTIRYEDCEMDPIDVLVLEIPDDGNYEFSFNILTRNDDAWLLVLSNIHLYKIEESDTLVSRVVGYSDVYGALTEPTRTGYTFNGYYTLASGGASVSSSTTMTSTTGATIYAHWTANSYTVKYDANVPTGATAGGTMADSTFSVNSAGNLRTNAYTASSKGLITEYGDNPLFLDTYLTFNGWNTKADGSGTSYTDGQRIENLTLESNGTVTLYAQWKVVYTFIYDSEYFCDDLTDISVEFGGQTITLAYGETKTLEFDYSSSPTPITINAQNSDKQNYLVQLGVDNPYQRYGANKNSYTVHVSGMGNIDLRVLVVAMHRVEAVASTGIASASFDWYMSSLVGNFTAYDYVYSCSGITFNATLEAGYSFKGWYTNADGTGTPVSTNLNYVYTTYNTSAGLQGPITLYAIATANPYTLTFDANGGEFTNGTTTQTRSVVFGEAYGELPTPVRDGYTFNGWEDASGNSVTASTIMTNADTTIYADWGINEYVLTVIYGTTYANSPHPSNITISGGGKSITLAYDESGTLKFNYSLDAITFTISKVNSERNYYIETGSSAGDNSVTYSWIPSENSSLTVNVVEYISVTAVAGTGVQSATFDVDSNTDVSDQTTGTYRAGSGITFNAELGDGYKFKGWYTNAQGTGTALSSNITYIHTTFNAKAGLREDITVYAIAEIDADDIKITTTGYTGVYDGAEHNISVAVSQSTGLAVSYQWYKGTTLISGATTSAYAVKNVADSGTYYCKVTVGDVSVDSSNITVSITSANMSNTTITLNPTEYTYDATAHTPTETVKFGSMTLVKDTDYTISYSNNTNAGTATATVTGKGNFTGTNSATFKINAMSLSSATFSAISDYTYTGGVCEPKPSVTLSVNGTNTTIVEGTDFTYSYTNNINAGTATVTITGKGNYTGTASTTFTIKKASMTITTSGEGSYVYDSTEKKATVQASLAGVTISFGTSTSYGSTGTISAVNGSLVIGGLTNVGTVTYYYKASKTNYEDVTGSITITITPRNLAGVSGSYNSAVIADIEDQTFTGSAIQPSVSVTMEGISTSLLTYNVSYSNNIQVGTATVTVTGTGNFIDSVSKTFEIVQQSADGDVAISGTTTYGETLTASVNGGINGLTYNYKWYSATSTTGTWTAIPGATSSSLVLSSSVIGANTVAGLYLKVEVTSADSNYSFSKSKTTTQIATKAISLTGLQVENKVYDGTNSATITTHAVISGGVLNTDTVTLVTSSVTATFASASVGTKTVTATGYTISGLNAGNYNLNGTTTATANITTLYITVSATTGYSGITKDFDGTNVVKATIDTTYYTVSSNLATVSVQSAVYDSVNVGSRTITVKFSLTDTTNMAFTTGGDTITLNGSISKKTVEVIWSSNSSFVYNAKDQSANVTATFINVLGTSETMTVEFSGTSTTFTNVGSYTATASHSDSNYNFTNTTKAFTITPKEVTISWINLSPYTYTGSAQGPTGSATGIVSGDNASVTISGNSAINVGSYTATATLTGTSASNYSLLNDSCNWNIEAQKVTKPSVSGSLTYTGSAQSPTIATSSLYTISNNVQTNAGSYSAKVALNDKTNYTWTDGTTADLSLAWSIAKATSSLALNKTSVNTQVGKTEELTATITYVGTITNTALTMSGQGSFADISATALSGKVSTITINPTNPTTSAITITVTWAGDNNHNGCSAEFVLDIDNITITLTDNGRSKGEVTDESGEHSSAGDNTFSIEFGDTIKVRAEAKDGYAIYSHQVSGSEIVIANTIETLIEIELPAITENTEVLVNFEPIITLNFVVDSDGFTSDKYVKDTKLGDETKPYTVSGNKVTMFALSDLSVALDATTGENYAISSILFGNTELLNSNIKSLSTSNDPDNNLTPTLSDLGTIIAGNEYNVTYTLIKVLKVNDKVLPSGFSYKVETSTSDNKVIEKVNDNSTNTYIKDEAPVALTVNVGDTIGYSFLGFRVTSGDNEGIYGPDSTAYIVSVQSTGSVHTYTANYTSDIADLEVLVIQNYNGTISTNSNDGIRITHVDTELVYNLTSEGASSDANAYMLIGDYTFTTTASNVTIILTHSNGSTTYGSYANGVYSFEITSDITNVDIQVGSAS